MTIKPSILFLPKYPRMGASSRLRTYQFVGLLEAEGYQVEVKPFFNERYLQQLYSGKKPATWNILRCYMRRIWILLRAKSYQVIWVEKEVFPYIPASLEKWMYSFFKGKLILDFDDAIFHNYDLHENQWIRKVLGTKIAHIMQQASVVLAGSPYLEEYAKRAGAVKIVSMPTVIDWKKYSQEFPVIPANQPTIGWIGSPSTQRYLHELIPVFGRIYAQNAFTLLIINSKEKLAYSGDMIHLQWSEEVEVAAIQQMDIGIMPLPDSAWEQGKCAYKLIQYMACGKAVIASPVGVNVEIVKDGYNGYLAATMQDWEEKLLFLLNNPNERKNMGKNGQSMVQANYTIDQNMKRIRKLLQELL
ncbi:MAG: glycosyltransferase family 4 protein [Mongoliitalea sp.]